MASESKTNETKINVTLDEPLTSNSCVKLVVELLKYILYQKQQIPFTYDSLTQLPAKVKPTDKTSLSIKALMHSLKTTSDHLSSQFHLESCKLKEIAILVGATIISPKVYVRLELPSEILSSQEHFECKHVSRKPLLNLMRSMMECSEFQDAMTLPLNLTNTFVLLQKSDNNSVSEFFLPKPQYAPPTQTAKCFRIVLRHSDEAKTMCNCANVVKVYREIPESCVEEARDLPFTDNSDEKTVRASYTWYQSREVIKGFKFMK